MRFPLERLAHFPTFDLLPRALVQLLFLQYTTYAPLRMSYLTDSVYRRHGSTT